MFVPVNQPVINQGNEAKYLLECIETGWVSSEGPFVHRFENEFANRVDRKFGIAVSNGTTALDIAVDALGITQGDEVILPAFTIVSCIHQILRVGAKPVFIDSDLEHWNMQVDQIEKKITSKTKAILMVHIYGLPANVDEILELAKRYNLCVIEDAAEMHGQTYKGKACGSFGDISTFSFYPNKHVTTGEGGMLVTNSEELATKIRSLRNLCFDAENRFVHERIGWNARMTNMQAALGVAQLEQLDDFVSKKRQIGEYYNSEFSDLSKLQLPLSQTSYARNIYWVYGILLPKSCGVSAKQFMLELQSLGVGTRPFFAPLDDQPFLDIYGIKRGENCPNAKQLHDFGFYIPSGLGLTKTQMEYVSEKVKSVYLRLLK